MAGRTIDEKARMDFALAIGKALQKHDFKKTKPMAEEIVRIAKSAFLRGEISKEDAKLILSKAEELCTVEAPAGPLKQIGKSATLARGDETDVYGWIFRYDGEFRMINGATGHTEHSVRPKSGAEHTFTDKASNREIKVRFDNVYHCSIDVDITVSQTEAAAPESVMKRLGELYSDMNKPPYADGYQVSDLDLLKRVKQGISSKLIDGVPLTPEERDLLEKKDDASLMRAAASNPDWQGTIHPGQTVDAGGYRITAKSAGSRSATVDIKDSAGNIVTTEELDVGIDTTITIPKDGKEIAIFLHGVAGSAADMSVEVFDIGAGFASKAASAPVCQTLTINRGDKAVVGDYLLYYRADGNASRLQVIREKSGIPIDDFAPKSGRTVVKDDDYESKRVTITPQVVYAASVTLEVTVEDIQKGGDGSSGGSSGGGASAKGRDWSGMSDDELVDMAKDVIKRAGIRNRRDLVKGDGRGLYEVLRKRQLLDRAIPRSLKKVDKDDPLLKLGMQVIDRFSIRTEEELERIVGDALRGKRE